jgi:hypothetical protein
MGVSHVAVFKIEERATKKLEYLAKINVDIPLEPGKHSQEARERRQRLTIAG